MPRKFVPLSEEYEGACLLPAAYGFLERPYEIARSV